MQSLQSLISNSKKSKNVNDSDVRAYSDHHQDSDNEDVSHELANSSTTFFDVDSDLFDVFGYGDDRDGLDLNDINAGNTVDSLIFDSNKAMEKVEINILGLRKDNQLLIEKNKTLEADICKYDDQLKDKIMELKEIRDQVEIADR
jgi:hypothetical protein